LKKNNGERERLRGRERKGEQISEEELERKKENER